jgi:hypothetical protein
MKPFSVLKEAPPQEDVWGMEAYLHAFFNLGIRWR